MKILEGKKYLYIHIYVYVNKKKKKKKLFLWFAHDKRHNSLIRLQGLGASPLERGSAGGRAHAQDTKSRKSGALLRSNSKDDKLHTCGAKVAQTANRVQNLYI